jgi:hypothetical protein
MTEQQAHAAKKRPAPHGQQLPPLKKHAKPWQNRAKKPKDGQPQQPQPQVQSLPKGMSKQFQSQKGASKKKPQSQVQHEPRNVLARLGTVEQAQAFAPSDSQSVQQLPQQQQQNIQSQQSVLSRLGQKKQLSDVEAATLKSVTPAAQPVSAATANIFKRLGAPAAQSESGSKQSPSKSPIPSPAVAVAKRPGIAQHQKCKSPAHPQAQASDPLASAPKPSSLRKTVKRRQQPLLPKPVVTPVPSPISVPLEVEFAPTKRTNADVVAKTAQTTRGHVPSRTPSPMSPCRSSSPVPLPRSAAVAPNGFSSPRSARPNGKLQHAPNGAGVNFFRTGAFAAIDTAVAKEVVDGPSEEQHKRNVTAWDAMFAQYPKDFQLFERSLRVIARRYLDSGTKVKPLPVAEIRMELNAAFARYSYCMSQFPDCTDHSLFEDYVSGSEASLDPVRASVLGNERTAVAGNAWPTRNETLETLSTCVRVSDGAPLDPSLVTAILASASDNDDGSLERAIGERFNELFGIAMRFSISPDVSWIENYRHLRDAYAFASRFSRRYFSTEGLVSCVLSRVHENDMVIAHNRIARAFPNSYFCPVSLDHVSWTQLSDADFADKVLSASLSRVDDLSVGLGLRPGSLDDSNVRHLMGKGASMGNIAAAAKHVIELNDTPQPLQCWTDFGALSALLFRGMDVRLVLSVEERCRNFSPPRRFCDSEEWCGLSDVEFAGMVYRTLSRDDLCVFFGVKDLDSVVHRMLLIKPMTFEEMLDVLKKTSDVCMQT